MVQENKNKRVFLIEDDPAIIDVYSTAFKNAGISLEVINSGEQAMQKIKESNESEGGKPDLVLLDLILPDINGIEVLKAIKTDNNTKEIPVFVLSNQTSLDLEKAGDIKPDKFIIKANVTPTQLVKLLQEQLK